VALAKKAMAGDRIWESQVALDIMAVNWSVQRKMNMETESAY
jgi:hypothetical protein